jgi:hypothetical protein
MARAAPGRLIALDGFDLRELAVRARAIARAAGRGSGVSLIDASGIFTELAAADKEVEPPSPRTAMLLYAADLAFRMRWQIQPALAEGKTVVAAPYVDTALALGRAAGLDEAWMIELLRFAPKAAASQSLRTRRRPRAEMLSALLLPARRRR